MKSGLAIFFTIGCIFLALPAALAAPKCSHILVQSDPKDIIHGNLEALQKILADVRQEAKKDASNPDPLAYVRSLGDSGPREITFLLQGGYRLLLSHPQLTESLSPKDVARLEKGLKDMKWLEKAFGTNEVQVELLETAVEKNLPADFVAFLTERRNLESQRTYQEIKKADFLSKDFTAFKDLSESLAKVDWPAHFDATLWLKESLQIEILRVQEKVESEMAPLIRKPAYGYHEIEEGAHAFRRSLRWIKMYLNSYKYYFKLVAAKSPTPAEKELLLKYKEKFSLSYDSTGQILIRDTDYAQLLKSVDALRKIKHRGEMIEMLSRELTLFGRYDGKIVTKEEAHSIILNLLKKEEGRIEQKTQEMLTDYEARNGYRGMIIEAPK